jgi:hypothetical protein
MPYCASCDAELAADLRIGRETLCPHCEAYLHACIQCRFYEPTLHNQCLEPEADYVGDRVKANFCEFFSMAGGKTGRGETAAPGQARGRAPSPGGGGLMPGAAQQPSKPGSSNPASDRAREARAKLEALFKQLPQDDED